MSDEPIERTELRELRELSSVREVPELPEVPEVPEVPEAWRARNPCMTPQGFALLERLRQHPDAPRWNETIGDHVRASDLEVVQRFRERLAEPWPLGTHPVGAAAPPDDLLDWVARMRHRSVFFEGRIACGMNIARDWQHIPTMDRRDLAERLSELTPQDADLERLIVYDTSGTTGHAVVVPHHPRTLALNHALGEHALAMYAVQPEFAPGRIACLNVCAQVHTYVFPAIFSVWAQSGFAKVNLHPDDWLRAGEAGGMELAMQRARRFFGANTPQFITADPVAIAEMMRWQVGRGTRAIFSTAVALSPALRTRAEAYFGCPVIDWYSSTETGPIALAAPDGRGMLVAAPDIWVEALDADGFAVGPGEMGELTVTGGRNPYVPLLRYRTGDFGRIVDGRIHDLHGRAMVFLRAAHGALVNPVDIGRIMRLHCAFAQHQFIQEVDGSCRVLIRPIPGVPVDTAGLTAQLATLFGPTPIDLIVDPHLGDDTPAGKLIPYIQKATDI